MNMTKTLIIIFLLAVIFSPAVLAADNSLSTMAKIMSQLNHYPSEAEKATLKKLQSDAKATANIKVIAQAMINLQHVANDTDKPKLKKIAQDKTTMANERELAGIILNIAHKPSAADKKKLQAMID